MKKFILLCFKATQWCSIFADELVVPTFSIAAGEEADIEVQLNNDIDYTCVQFNLALPKGVEIVEDEYGLYVVGTDRLHIKDGRTYLDHAVNSNQDPDDGSYIFLINSSKNLNINDKEGAIITIKVKANDQVSTGRQNVSLFHQLLIEADGTKHVLTDATYSCTVGIKITVTTLGYASFSWPKVLDFSNSGLTAFIATSCDGSTIQLESVTKVPANTGLILKGTAGSENTYDLETTEEETDDVTGNKLSANTTDVYTVASDDIYVLSNLDDGKAGFYLAEQGVHVGKYKSYLQYAGTGVRKSLSFHEEQPTGIHNMDGRTADRLYFNLQGQRVNNPAKGLYISAGKKIIIK